MRALTTRSQATLTTIPQPFRLQLQQGSCKSTLWHAKSQVLAPRRHANNVNACTFCAVHVGFHQQRLAADVRKGTKDADYNPLAVEIRSGSRFILVPHVAVPALKNLVRWLKGAPNGP